MDTDAHMDGSVVAGHWMTQHRILVREAIRLAKGMNEATQHDETQRRTNEA